MWMAGDSRVVAATEERGWGRRAAVGLLGHWRVQVSFRNDNVTLRDLYLWWLQRLKVA